MRPLPLAVVTLVLAGAPARAEIVDRIVAIVNDAVITLSELESAAKTQVRAPAEAKPQEILAAKRQVLEGLIDARIVDQEARRLKITVAPREVEQAIENIAMENKVTLKELEKTLQEEGITMALYREQIADQLKRFKLISSEVRSKIAFSEEDLKTYYHDHLSRYVTPPRVRIRSVLVPVAAGAPETDRAAARARAAEIAGRAKAGASLSVIVGSLADVPAVEAPVESGVLNPDDLEPALKAALQGLAAGGVSDVIETRGGFLVLTVLERAERGLVPFATVRTEIREVLYKEGSEKKFREWLTEMRSKATVEVRF